MTDKENIGWVATPDKLEQLRDVLANTKIAAVDTEFVREKTYYPHLCLIQIACADTVACIDCLAPLDLREVFAELFRTDFTWVLHSARQDLEVIWHLTGRMPPKLIDTQIAAALTGAGAQIGLETLLKQSLGIELGESYARTDWSRRPLPPAAIAYALDDVRFLLAAWERLELQLTELGRMPWLHEDCARTLADSPETDPFTVWQKLKGVGALAPEARRAALALVRWRETAAQRADRPRRWLLGDDTLLAISAALPATPKQLERLIPPKLLARSGTELLATIEARNEPELVELAQAHSTELKPDKRKIKLLQQCVRERAEVLAIEPEILATRRDLVGLATDHAPPHLQNGWRAMELSLALDGKAETTT